MLHCGNVQILGESLIQFRTAVYHASHSLLDISDNGAWLYLFNFLGLNLFADTFLVQENTDEARPPNNRLIDLLDSAHNLQGSRIHDRIYAIMYLADDYQEGDITIDYTKSAGQNMACAANHHVRLHRNLRFLHDADWGDRSCEIDLVHSIPSWIPSTWLGNTGQYSLRSYQRLHERMSENEQAVEDNTYESDSFRDENEELFNRCSPHCVDAQKMRLRAHGMKLGKVQSLLKRAPDDEIASVAQFWSSALGQHIEPYMSGAGRKIPLQIIRTIAYIWGPNEYSYDDAVNALTHLFELGQKPETAHCLNNVNADETRVLISALRDENRAAGDALCGIFQCINLYTFILTDRGYFGRVRRSAIRAGDEIWMILGCSLPVILRRQSDGTYSRICTARIPVLMDDILGTLNIRNFSPKSVPGDKFGEWTVEYIEII
jgi:hypothetical protein